MISLLSGVIFVATSTTLALVICLVFGQLTTFIAGLSIGVGLLASAFCIYKWGKIYPCLKRFNYFEWLMILFFVVFCFRHFLWLVFENGNSVLTLDASNFGELPHHMAFINFLVRGAHFWPENQILSGTSFSAPFGMDLFSALFTKLGFPLLYHLPLTGFLAGILLLIALLYWGGGFAVGAFLFAGGGLNYMSVVFHELKNYQDGKPWGSIILLFITQGGFLYALPAGLLILWSWRRRFFTDDLPLPTFIEGLLWGTMPFFNLQTFVFLTLTYFLWFATTHKKSAMPVFIWAFLPALVEIFYITDKFKKSAGLWWKSGWMIDNDPVFMYFWSNYGLFLFFSLATLYLSIKKPKIWRQILPGVLLFTSCYFVVFSPWEWDNIKFMMWCYILILPQIYDLTIKPFSLKLQSFIIFAMFVPGFLAVASMHGPKNRGNEIYTREVLDGVCQSLKDASPEARVATAQIHNHPVLLCGHPVVAGYAGTLWAWGMPAEGVQTKLNNLMRGQEDWRKLARELHARYLFWGPYEISEYADSTKPWGSAGLKVVGQGDWGIIYDLESDVK